MALTVKSGWALAIIVVVFGYASSTIFTWIERT